jgi:hypothetical protein
MEGKMDEKELQELRRIFRQLNDPKLRNKIQAAGYCVDPQKLGEVAQQVWLLDMKVTTDRIQ